MAKILTEKICKQCNNSFTTTHINKQHCSSKCYQESYRLKLKLKQCDVCTKKFKPTSRQRYCSEECAKYAKLHAKLKICYSCKLPFSSVNDQLMCYSCRQSFGRNTVKFIELQFNNHITALQWIKAMKHSNSMKQPRCFDLINYDELSKVLLATIINDNYSIIHNLIQSVKNYYNISIGITKNNRIRITDNTYKYTNNDLRYQISIILFIKDYL